ncbi:MAG: glycosyltransferase family 4 protein [Gammaproteobacteria bacterium]|nr:glycosyltransferase family 4 protein [Gammaproteobacteria bacterium]
MTLKIASIVPSHTAGGIGPVCGYAAESLANNEPWEVSIVALHDPERTYKDPDTGLNVISLGLANNHCEKFLKWLDQHPQDVVITSDVNLIEPAFPYFPPSTAHIVQLHDSMKRYRQVAIRNHMFIDGVVTVANHLLVLLNPKLDKLQFKGLTRSVHNGASYPEPCVRESDPEKIRLLFVGRMDPIKGIFDLPPLLHQLDQLNVPAELRIVGGESEALKKKFEEAGVERNVIWSGKIPHQECFEAAANSEVLLMISRVEAFGMVTIEAMSMGCVPIAYDLPSGSREIIEDGKNGFVINPGKIPAFADLIENLHGNRRYLEQLGNSAAERARTQFNATDLGRELGKFIRDVLKNKAQHPSQRITAPPQFTEVKKTSGKYQVIPESFRSLIRKTLCDYPNLTNWIFRNL